LVDKRRIRVAPPSLQTHFRPTRLPSQPELTRPIFSARARICSSLSHSDELLIVLLVSTACYLPWFIFVNLSKNLALMVFVSFIIYRVQFTFMYALFVWFVPRNSRREFANDDEKKPGVRCQTASRSPEYVPRARGLVPRDVNRNTYRELSYPFVERRQVQPFPFWSCLSQFLNTTRRSLFKSTFNLYMKPWTILLLDVVKYPFERPYLAIVYILIIPWQPKIYL